MTISPEQLRAARGLLSISQDQLAQDTGVAIASIRHFESGTTKKLQQKTENALHTFFSECVEFIGARGVALHEKNHFLIEGDNAKKTLLDDIAEHRRNGELLILCGDPAMIPFEIAQFYAAIEEKGIPSRHICSNNCLPFPLKMVPSQFKPTAFQFVYGSTVAQIISPQKIQLTRSNLLAESFGQVFELLWSLLPDAKPSDSLLSEKNMVVEGA